jgi:pimeloyl-ACP methyl ester carboxylesterase
MLLGRAVALSALGAIAVFGCSSSGSTNAAADARARTSASGAFDSTVMVRGVRIHAICEGAGPVTVVLVPGLGVGANTMDGVLGPIGKFARVCAYDPPGVAPSGPPAGNQTFVSRAQDLTDLLAALNEHPPYVVVGHSIGGGTTVEFAHLHSDQVRGLLLLDATPVGWAETVLATPADTDADSQFRDSARTFTDPTANPERFDGVAAFAEVATVDSLGQIPLMVDEATRKLGFIGLEPEQRERVAAAWHAGQQHWASLSTSGAVQLVDSGHQVQQDQPALVVDQVRTLVER